ncbi:hypothetical protein [Qingshengfaniella alkalisoli]|uniref:Uncharacterized protein n=1 Tax=Qingshengfaniella alkalisoli TaxID=2599296 RepID=A0A5B8IYE7_9RHOB|nr:hypothetical protein [Qingshengfaniella alkalisoli]QDY69678.1 hypothetical protein FPZ52_08625 [Qingshengfaniella alkalisoli]
MPLPIAPAATIALRLAPVALALYAAARHAGPSPRRQKAEDVLDELDDGLHVSEEPEGWRADGRLRRKIRFGHSGPGFEIDASGFGRLKLRRI